MHGAAKGVAGARRGVARRRRAAAWASLVVSVVMIPSTAWAHVTVVPGEVVGGGFAMVSFRVPTERDDASTTKVQVLLPADQPVGSVRTRPVPGWRVTATTRTLDEPIDLFGEQLDSVVSELTWTATGAGIAPAQFEDFDVSLGPLPETGEMVFTAIQTYSNGEVVKWNEVAVDAATEPEHPAPVLTITAPESPDASSSSRSAVAPGSDDREGPAVLPSVLSGLALLTAVAALGVALRRRT